MHIGISLPYIGMPLQKNSSSPGWIIRGCCRIINAMKFRFHSASAIQIVVNALVLHPPLLNHIQKPWHIQPIQ